APGVDVAELAGGFRGHRGGFAVAVPAIVGRGGKPAPRAPGGNGFLDEQPVAGAAMTASFWASPAWMPWTRAGRRFSHRVPAPEIAAMAAPTGAGGASWRK